MEMGSSIIVGEKYAFIHFPKTGGARIQEVLEKYDSGIVYRQPDEDKGLLNLPSMYLDRFIFGFIRNPWDFYFSLFYYFKYEVPNNVYLKFCSNNFKDEFAISVKKLLSPKEYMTKDEYSNYLKYIITTNHKSFKDNDFKIPIEDFIFMEKNDIGFCSLLYYVFFYRDYNAKMNTQNLSLLENVHIYKYENLRQSMSEILHMILGIDTEKAGEEFDIFGNVNRKKPQVHYSSVYDKELVDLVRKKDAMIIDRYGYTFESVVGKK